MTRTYKGYEIVKQTVGPMGWNISLNGKCVKTGSKTLDDAKEWIAYQIDSEEMRKAGI